MKIQQIISNLSNTAIRREILHGRQHIVAPMAMLTEGVHHGSGGPLLYREADTRKAVPAWNMKPVVVYHPEINGQGVSACDPDILNAQQVGIVMNTRWQGKLRAEAWIDEERAGLVDDRVLDALESNKMMEVSTGLFTDNDGVPGEWNGIPYDGAATNHQPDHLALLPDKIGACSIADGAGLLQLNELASAADLNVEPLFARQLDILRRMVGNAMSHSNIYSALAQAIRAKIGGDDVWVADVYDGFFVYEAADKLFKLTYSSSDAGVELSGDPEEVVRVTEYRTAKGDFVGNNAPPTKENDMAKKDLVDGLIAHNSTQWAEADRETLMNMDEGVLGKMAPPTANDGGEGGTTDPATPTPAPAQPAATGGDQGGETATPAQPVTMEAYIAAAPPEMRDVLQNGVNAHEKEKASLIETITANTANPFSKEFLATKPIAELQGLAALAKQPEAAPAPATGPVPMFNGAATPAAPAPTTNDGNGEAEQPLMAPTMNWDDEKVPA